MSEQSTLAPPTEQPLSTAPHPDDKPTWVDGVFVVPTYGPRPFYTEFSDDVGL